MLALFVLPFLAFSQQTGIKNPGKKKEIKVGVIKNTYKTQQVHTQRPAYKYSEEYRIANGIPDDFPRYINTGNPKPDADNYYMAKQLWIKNNPSRFEKLKDVAL